MSPIFDLIKKFDIKTVDVSLDDNNNIFYYKNKIMNKPDVRLSNGMTIFEFEDYAISNLKKKYPKFKNEDVYDYDEISKMNINDFFKKYGKIKKSDMNLWFAYYGYDKLLDNVQVSIWLFDKDFYTSKYSDSQQYIKTGMVTFVEKLFQHSNVNLFYNTKVISIEKDKDGMNIVYTMNNNYEYKTYKCKYLILAITPRAINEINIIKPIQISSERLHMIKQVIQVPLFKCFLKWDKDKIWWGPNKKYHSGKSVTDLVLRQVHYYNDEDILIYNSGKYATKLNNMFTKNPALAEKFVYSCIQKMHPFKIPEPNYKYTIYKYWPDGSSAWKLNTDVNLASNLIPDGNIDKSNIYVVGDSYSKYQGWIVGSIYSCDVAYPLILENMK